eukprot:1147598-Pelagomonas_calceolata.AAC.1
MQTYKAPARAFSPHLQPCAGLPSWSERLGCGCGFLLVIFGSCCHPLSLSHASWSPKLDVSMRPSKHKHKMCVIHACLKGLTHRSFTSRGLTHRPFTSQLVKGGDKIDLGQGHVMEFVMAPNLH